MTASNEELRAEVARLKAVVGAVKKANSSDNCLCGGIGEDLCSWCSCAGERISSILANEKGPIVVVDGYAASDIGHEGDGLGSVKLRLFPDNLIKDGPLADVPVTVAVFTREET